VPSGGHARSGPSPDPNALRRERDKAEWSHLPAAGREAPAPVWPLSRATAREIELWTEEWQRPQAVAWEANGQQREVALYVRSLKDAEKPNASVAARTLVQRQMDTLGLTVSGLRANRWVIADQPARKVTRSDDPDRAGAKSRFKTIEGGVAS